MLSKGAGSEWRSIDTNVDKILPSLRGSSHHKTDTSSLSRSLGKKEEKEEGKAEGPLWPSAQADIDLRSFVSSNFISDFTLTKKNLKFSESLNRVEDCIDLAAATCGELCANVDMVKCPSSDSGFDFLNSVILFLAVGNLVPLPFVFFLTAGQQTTCWNRQA